MSKPLFIESEEPEPKRYSRQSFAERLLERYADEQRVWLEAVQAALDHGSAARLEYVKGVVDTFNYLREIAADMAKSKAGK